MKYYDLARNLLTCLQLSLSLSLSLALYILYIYISPVFTGRNESYSNQACKTRVSNIFGNSDPFAYTPPKINIEPENDGLEDDFPFPVVYSQVPC